MKRTYFYLINFIIDEYSDMIPIIRERKSLPFCEIKVKEDNFVKIFKKF